MPYSVLRGDVLRMPAGGYRSWEGFLMIIDQRNGLLVPSHDVKAMTTACQMLLNDSTLAARLGRQAWVDCCEYYRPDKIANETIAAYRAAINNFSLRDSC